LLLQNALKAGVADVANGSTAPGTMSSAESDKYIQNQRKLKFAGADIKVNDAREVLVKVGGIPVTPGPRIILTPAFGITQEEILAKVGGAEKCSISERSSLVLDGHYLTIKNIEVDGALVIHCGPKTHVTVDGLKVQNKGWVLEELDPSKAYPETVSIRGYTMNKQETAEYILEEPGSFVIGADGEVKKV
jgi:UDP-sugar pyrophosphorylase